MSFHHLAASSWPYHAYHRPASIRIAASPRTYLTWGKWRNLTEHILQNIHVNDNDPSTHTLHITHAKTEKIPNVTSKFLSHEKTRLLNMTCSNFNVQSLKVFVAMATNLLSCFSFQFLERLLKFLVNFTLLK